MLNTVHDESKVARREPWEIENERSKAALISRLRGAVDDLYPHGFLVDKENLEKSTCASMNGILNV
jgi:hypothetical protein